MSDRFTQQEQLDDELRSIAATARDENERSVAADETAAALALVRARLADGDRGDTARPVPTTGRARAPQRARLRWAVVAALTAAAAVAIGVVVVRDDPADTIVPVTTPTSNVAPPSDPSVPSTDPSIPPTSPTVPETAPTSTLEPSTTATAATTATNETVASASQDGETLAIPSHCTNAEPCTQLVVATDGRLVVYEPRTESVDVYDPAGSTVLFSAELAEPLAAAFANLTYAGPDDVVYFTVDTPGNDDPSNDLIAIPLTGPRAGSIVRRDVGLDGSGDSALVPTADGLAVVPCCGASAIVPDPAATTYAFVDRTGEPIRSASPTFRLDLGDVGNSLVRIEADGSETAWTLPTALRHPRDFPAVVSSSEGGAFATDYLQFGEPRRVIVRFGADWPANATNNGDVYFVDESFGFVSMVLEPSGTVVVAEAERFVRYSPAAIGSAGWPGAVATDFDSWTVAAPGLNDHIAAEQPNWAAVPESFGMQFVQTVGPNEQIQFEFDEATGVLTITRSGLLDDSVAASQLLIRTEVGGDGLYRFVSGTIAQRCQPGRGQQDFRPAICT